MTPPPARPEIPEIVAHRGDAEHFPENSLAAIESAWKGGIRHVEFDVQVAADGVPYVIHDSALERTTHGAGDLRLMTSGQLDGVDAGEPARFGRRHAGTRLPRLAAVAELMADYRRRVPSSRSSERARAPRPCALHRMDIRGARGRVDRCIVISFDALACRLARAAQALPVGWVLGEEPATQLAALEDLRPEYVFCDHRRLAWSRAGARQSWTWVVYEVRDAAQAVGLRARGVAMVESMAPLRLREALT